MDNRRFTRVPFEATAVLKYAENLVKGEIEDISLNGIFVHTDERIEPDETVEVQVLFLGTSSQLSINLFGTIKRHTDEGMAVQFTGMYLDSFIHLRNLISYNLGDQKKVMDEFFAYMHRDD